MSNNTKKAIECFKENIDLFADPKNQPEKYNLYAGLINLAKAIERIENDLIVINENIKIIDKKNK